MVVETRNRNKIGLLHDSSSVIWFMKPSGECMCTQQQHRPHFRFRSICENKLDSMSTFVFKTMKFMGFCKRHACLGWTSLQHAIEMSTIFNTSAKFNGTRKVFFSSCRCKSATRRRFFIYLHRSPFPRPLVSARFSCELGTNAYEKATRKKSRRHLQLLLTLFVWVHAWSRIDPLKSFFYWTCFSTAPQRAMCQLFPEMFLSMNSGALFSYMINVNIFLIKFQEILKKLRTVLCNNLQTLLFFSKIL
jgi:hypothetical protein